MSVDGGTPWVTSLSGGVDRKRVMPGDYVARPLTVPEGTFLMSFRDHSTFIDNVEGAQRVAWMPAFALGLTSAIEIAVDIPTRFDESAQAWTSLDPRPKLTLTWYDTPELELGASAAYLIPAGGDAEPNLELGVPLLWHASPKLRIDSGVAGEITFEDKIRRAARIPVVVTYQVAHAFYAGLAGVGNIKLSQDRRNAFDAYAVAGFTLQSRGVARFEVEGRFFMENLGTAYGTGLTDGAGTLLTVRFFPELY